MFRDIDYIRGKWWSVKEAEPKQNNDRLRYNVQNLTDVMGDITRFKKSARYFLVNDKHHDGQGQLVHHNSFFKNVSDFHSLQVGDRLYDRLFYDVDKHNDVIDGFKHDLRDIKARQIGSDVGYSYKQKLKDIKEKQAEYRNYVLNDNDGDFLADPYNDTLKIVQYYQDRGVEPIVNFTGGAGFHINVLFEPVHLKNPSDVFLSYTNLIASKTGVKIDDNSGESCLDDAPPQNAETGTQRTPYSIHEKSGLNGFIVPDDTDYDDLLAMIKRNRPQVSDFTYDDHLVPDLLMKQIINTDNEAGVKKVEKTEQVKKQYNTHRSTGNGDKDIYIDGVYIGTVSHDDGRTDLSSDLRYLWDLMVIDGAVKPVDDKDIRQHYNRVRCGFPDHDDKNPSAIVGKYRYKCFKCCPDGINWYVLIGVVYGIIDPDDIKKNVTQEQKARIKDVIHKLQQISSDR